MEYYGIAHALPRCKKCSSYKQLRECDKENGFSSYTIIVLLATQMLVVWSLVHVAVAQYCAVARERVNFPIAH